jgi:outer membrane receptor protein involved in Fe transport
MIQSDNLIQISIGFARSLFSLVIYFTLVLPVTQAQSNIHGKIVDSIGKPIPNANVLLLNFADSVLVKGLLSSEDGQYSFENIKTGRYTISATHTGNNPAYSPHFEVTDKQENIDMGIMKLNETPITLSNVAVTAKKPLYERKIDRLQINVAASIVLAGTTALDVLERSPGIRVDRMNNSISINGKGGVIVMINGKRNYMEISALVQMLAAMPSGNIERIEVITTPPANYDAQGDAGIINIILKSNGQYGTNGTYSVSAGYTRGFDGNGNFTFNHRTNKINLFGNYSFYGSTSGQTNYNYRAVVYQGDLKENYSETNRDPIVHQHNIQAGIDYEINKKSIIGVLATGYYRSWDMVATNYAQVSTNGRLDTSATVINNELHITGNVGINLNWQHNFKENEKLTFNVDYLHYHDDNPSDYTNSYYGSDGSFLYDEKMESTKVTPLELWIAAGDYSKKLSKKADLEAGVKGTLSSFENEVLVRSLDQNNWETDSALSGVQNLKESIGAAYVSLSVQVTKKTSAKFGLRYEYTSTNLRSETKQDLVDRQYGNLFPSLFLMHSIDDNNAINFSYSKRIWRPGFFVLAPYVIFYDPKTFFTGNPALQPSITDAFDASYTYKNKMVTLSYSFTADPITQFYKIDEATNRMIMAYMNASNNEFIGLSLSLPFQATKWWNMQNTLSGYWQKVNTFYKEEVQRKYTSLYAYSTQSFVLHKNYFFEVSGYFSSGGGWGLGEWKPMGSLDLGIQKKFPEKKSDLRLSVRNILNTQDYINTTSVPDQNLYLRNSGNWSNINFSFTFTHSFGNDKVKAKRQRTTGAEEEQGRAN